MTSVDGISSIYIRGNSVSVARVRPEYVDFVCRRVRSQDGVLVDIVCVSLASAWMICLESKRVEILTNSYNRWQLVVILETWEP